MTTHSAAALQPRKKPRQKRGRETWDIILEAAAQVIAKNGYAGTSTNHIAAPAGVSVGTIYEYFPNKDVLLSELQSQWNDKCWEFQKSLAPVDPAASIQESIRLLIERWVSLVTLNTELYAALVQDLPTRANKSKADQRLVESIKRVAMEVSRHHEVIRIDNIALASEILVRGLHGYFDHLVVVDPEKLRQEELVTQLTDLLCGFLLSRSE